MLPLSFASGKHLWSLVYCFFLKIFKKINTTTLFLSILSTHQIWNICHMFRLLWLFGTWDFFKDELDCCMLSDIQRYLTCECVCVCFWSVCAEDGATTVSNRSTGVLQLPAHMKLLHHFLEYFPVILSACFFDPFIIICNGICSLACHCDESDCAQCDRRPAGDFALCAVSWESATWEAVAAQLRLGEDAERKFTVF